jgi:serine O-acetyltransferase
MARCIRTIREDIKVIMERDPAARNTVEILLCYPGLHALFIYRISHFLWVHGLKLAGRLLSQTGRFLTGIEIHPGATIGRRFFIDHGMGVVVGETSVIGDDVTLYQGVTLGGKSWKKEKRHPDLADHVVVGAGTKIIGPCVIGSHTRIGANSVVVRNVPPRSTVVGVPGRVILSQEGEPHEEVNLEHHLLPDPEEEAIQFLIKKVRSLEKKLKEHERLLTEGTAGQGEPPPSAAKK